jgi:tRNA dimethylallyltransferase
MKKSSLPKILVILGPTASGKSKLAIELAKKYKGEIISADSRQIYKGMDIGTGKVTRKEMFGIPHHMLDIENPKNKYSVAKWQSETTKIIEDIISRNKLPIICGGTGFYIESITKGVVLPEVWPNHALRKKLKNKTTLELFNILSKLDKKRAESIDKNNPVRLVRAIEIAKAVGSVPKLINKPKFISLQIGIDTDSKILREKINKRVDDRIKIGMIKEVENLHKKGLSWKRMDELGLEYKYISEYLRKKVSKNEMIEKLKSEIWQYARRQMTWFRKDKNIKWFDLKNSKEISKEINSFLTEK